MIILRWLFCRLSGLLSFRIQLYFLPQHCLLVNWPTVRWAEWASTWGHTLAVLWHLVVPLCKLSLLCSSEGPMGSRELARLQEPRGVLDVNMRALDGYWCLLGNKITSIIKTSSSHNFMTVVNRNNCSQQVQCDRSVLAISRESLFSSDRPSQDSI